MKRLWMYLVRLWQTPTYHDAKVRFEGWCEAIEAVRASLRAYPDGGGDMDIMAEVERIEDEAWLDGYRSARENL